MGILQGPPCGPEQNQASNREGGEWLSGRQVAVSATRKRQDTSDSLVLDLMGHARGGVAHESCLGDCVHTRSYWIVKVLINLYMECGMGLRPPTRDHQGAPLRAATEGRGKWHKAPQIILEDNMAAHGKSFEKWELLLPRESLELF